MSTFYPLIDLLYMKIPNTKENIKSLVAEIKEEYPEIYNQLLDSNGLMSLYSALKVIPDSKFDQLLNRFMPYFKQQVLDHHPCEDFSRLKLFHYNFAEKKELAEKQE